MKICVWYIVANEPEYLNPSIEIMSSYDWVDYIIVVHTNTLDKIDDHFKCIGNEKTISYAKDFGYSFEISINQGGFNEVDARNKAIELADCLKCDWLVQCDADEFYTYNTIDIIRKADKEGFDSINIDCVHPISATRAYFPKENPRDAHRRIWRSGRGIKYDYNPDILKRSAAGEKGLENKSLHCIPVGFKKMMEAEGSYHIHCHHLFGAKKAKGEWVESDGVGLKDFDSNLLPDLYKDIILKEQNI
jgi:hypothetical protein